MGLMLVPYLLFNDACAETPLSVKEAMLFDIASTKLGMTRGMIELNPLGLAGSTAVKGVLLYHVEKENSSIDKDDKRFIANLYTAASLNNLTVAVLNPPLVLSFILVATYYQMLENASD